VIVPVLCSSGRQYRTIYRLGILQTYAFNQMNSPKVIPYFGVSSFFDSTFKDFVNTGLSLARLSRLKLLRTRVVSRIPAEISLENHLVPKTDFQPDLIDSFSLRFNIRETTENVANRFLVMLDWILKNEDVDFIWHSNISTYLNLSRMQIFLDGVSQDFFYAGAIGDFDEFSFVSGASVCLSRDTAELVISNQKNWDFSLPWDVALGKLLHGLSVAPTPIERIDLLRVSEVSQLPDEVLKNTINFRCKAGGWKRIDHEIMKSIHERLFNLRKN
jgi:hypothetical protein